jgi:hypothetical protein
MVVEADVVTEIFDKVEKKVILFTGNGIVIDAEETGSGIVQVDFE